MDSKEFVKDIFEWRGEYIAQFKTGFIVVKWYGKPVFRNNIRHKSKVELKKIIEVLKVEKEYLGWKLVEETGRLWD